MPEDQTDLMKKPANGNGSQIFNVSMRGWLALLLTATVCTIQLTPMLLSALHVQVVESVVEEPLYSAFLIALGFYFGQKTDKPPKP